MCKCTAACSATSLHALSRLQKATLQTENRIRTPLPCHQPASMMPPVSVLRKVIPTRRGSHVSSPEKGFHVSSQKTHFQVEFRDTLAASTQKAGIHTSATGTLQELGSRTSCNCTKRSCHWMSSQPQGYSVGKAVKPARSDCEALCWNLAARRLGEQPHAGSYSAGQFSSSFGSFTQPCTQWLHKADYKLQRIPEGAKSDAGANEPRGPYPGDRMGQAGKGLDHTNPRLTRQRRACLGNRGSLSALFSGARRPWGLRRPALARAQPPVRACGTGDPAGRCSPPGHWALRLFTPTRSLKFILLGKAGIHVSGQPGEQECRRCAGRGQCTVLVVLATLPCPCPSSRAAGHILGGAVAARGLELVHHQVAQAVQQGRVGLPVSITVTYLETCGWINRYIPEMSVAANRRKEGCELGNVGEALAGPATGQFSAVLDATSTMALSSPCL